MKINIYLYFIEDIIILLCIKSLLTKLIINQNSHIGEHNIYTDKLELHKLDEKLPCYYRSMDGIVADE